MKNPVTQNQSGNHKKAANTPTHQSVSTKNAMITPTKNTIHPSRNHTISAPDYAELKASSATDCTGLIPAAPADEDELENYEELYAFLPQAAPESEKNT